MIAKTLLHRLIVLDRHPELVRAFKEKAIRDRIPEPTKVQILERIDVPALKANER